MMIHKIHQYHFFFLQVFDVQINKVFSNVKNHFNYFVGQYPLSHSLILFNLFFR